MTTFASAGSQRWLQVAVNRKRDLLLGALQRCGAIGQRASITWVSPLEDETEHFREYQGREAFEKVGIAKANLKSRQLEDFWPARGPVWDALGTSEGHPVFIEAKAHIPEAVTPGTKAVSSVSQTMIKQSLDEARDFYAPKSTAEWNNLFYQYANRLAHQYFLRKLNSVPSILVFLYFLNADDMLGPMSEEEWQGAVRLIHAVLGLPKGPRDLARFGVFHAFLDVRFLQDAVESDNIALAQT